MQSYISRWKGSRMEQDYKKQLNKLQEISKKGVRLYYDDKPALPRDIVKEDMRYGPEFIVVDEHGKLKEIWYEKTSL